MDAFNNYNNNNINKTYNKYLILYILDLDQKIHLNCIVNFHKIQKFVF